MFIVNKIEGELYDSQISVLSVIDKSGSSFTVGKPDEFTQKSDW